MAKKAKLDIKSKKSNTKKTAGNAPMSIGSNRP